MKIYDGNTNARPRLSPPHIRLTRRQSECFFLLAHGYTTKKIAKILRLQTCSVEDLIQRIKDKMGISYKSDLIERAIEFLLSSAKQY